MHLKIGYFIRLIALSSRIGLAIRPHLRMLKVLMRLLSVVLDIGPSWLFKLVLRLTVYLVEHSRSDADARAALAILKEVHGGKGPMFKERIVQQMCREPDEMSSYYSNIVHATMHTMTYDLPGGSRLWFLMLTSNAVVGWKIIQAPGRVRRSPSSRAGTTGGAHVPLSLVRGSM